MSILERAREIILNPKVTWQVIKEEGTDVKQLLINYAAPLVLVPAICTLVGLSLIGIRMPAGQVARAPFIEAFVGGALGYALHLGGLFVGAWALSRLAPLFNCSSDLNSAMKVIVYSMTPVWLVGIFSVLPGLGLLSILGLYGIYLLALGLPPILECPPNKVIWLTISVLVLGLVINIILSIILVGTIYGPMYLRMMAV